MQKSIIASLKLLVSFFAIAGTFIANAQKLPNKQEIGLMAPAIIKIDGDATEWGGNFQAFNHATEIFYTIANDNNNLYLIIQATEPLVMRKIVAAGITFTINNAGKTLNQENVSVTYPVYDKDNLPSINLRNKPEDITKVDSFKKAINKQLSQKSKRNKIVGYKRN